jgi:hypothetical protein
VAVGEADAGEAAVGVVEVGMSAGYDVGAMVD